MSLTMSCLVWTVNKDGQHPNSPQNETRMYLNAPRFRVAIQRYQIGQSKNSTYRSNKFFPDMLSVALGSSYHSYVRGSVDFFQAGGCTAGSLK